MSNAYVTNTILPLTGSELIDATTNGYEWYFYPGSPRVLNWSVSSSKWGSTILQSTTIQNNFKPAFGAIAEFVNVSFSFLGYFSGNSSKYGYQVAYDSGSDINIAYSYDGVTSNGIRLTDGQFIESGQTSKTATAFAYFPNLNNIKGKVSYLGQSGDVWLNENDTFIAGLTFTQGDSGYSLLLHEILHGLGLKHPHDDGGTGRPTYSNLGVAYFDRQWVTVMSYDKLENGGDGAYSGSMPIGPMIMDAIALQFLYGESKFNAGNTSYDLSRYIGNYYNCQWDSSGTDLLDGSKVSYGLCVDLGIDTAWNGWGDHHIGFITTAIDYVSLGLLGYNPQKWTWLWGEYENLSGTAFDDVLFGNDLDNSISGGNGNDYLEGRGGDDVFDWESNSRGGIDTLVGGEGNDTYCLDSPSDSVIENAGEGVDTVYVEFNYSLVGTFLENLKTYNNLTRGVKLLGNSYQNELMGGGGNDTISGLEGLDSIWGAGGNDSIDGGPGNDSILGESGDDTIFGGQGNDYLSGGAGNDLLQGDSGDDPIEGGNGIDTLLLLGLRANYSITWLAASSQFKISSAAEGADIISGIEKFRFSDVSIESTTLQDNIPPTVAILSNRVTLALGQTAILTFLISEAVSDFTVGDITVSGGMISNFTGSGTSYSATFTPTANSTTNGVVSVGNSKFSDAAGNFNVDGSDANNAVSMTVNTVPADTVPPTIAISSNRLTLSVGQTATLTFAISESVSDFVVGDITVSGGTLSNFSGSGTSYTATFIPATNSTINGVVSVSNSKFSDAAGNFNVDGSDANNTVTMQLNTANTLLWTRLIGSVGSDEVWALSTGLDGSIYAAGYTDRDIDGKANSGGWDAFLTKYATDGTKVWTRLLGSTGDDWVNALTAGRDRAIYMAGATKGPLFDGRPAVGYLGTTYAFLTKYAADGTKAWSSLLGPKGYDNAYALTTGSDGAIYVAGTAGESVDSQINRGSLDAFLTKYSPDGVKVWTRLFGSNGTDYGEAVTVGKDGSIYLAGFTDSTSIDGQANNGSYDTFLTKYAPDGTKTWTRLLGSNGLDQGYELATGADGSIYLAGTTNSTSFDGQNSSGSLDVFLTKFSENGTKAWTRLLGGKGDDIGEGIKIGADGSIYMVGSTNSTSIDGQATSGKEDTFLVKYSSDGTKIWTSVLGAAGADSPKALTIGKDGAIYIGGSSDSVSLNGQRNIGGIDGFLAKVSDYSIVLDTTPPTIAITSNQWSITGGQTATLIFAISELVSDFVVGDITVSGGTLSNFSGSGTSYSATFTPATNSTTNGVVSVGNSKFSDAAGNFNVDGSDADNTVTITVNTVTAVTKIGTTSDDSLVGSAVSDLIYGLAGNDTLDGGFGADTLFGGVGNDTYYVDNIGDSVVELAGEGTDTEIASLSVYLPTNVENLTLTGTAYFGVGNALDNAITGSNAGNLLLGGAGNDTIRGGDAREAIFGESGNDSISGGGGVDYLIGGTGNDTIDGGTGADEIYGEDGSDSISGGSDFQTDILVGGAGNDTLDGGPAWDLMYGNAGDDTYYISQQVDWCTEQPNEGYDTVIADSPNGFYLYANIEKLVLVGTTPFGVGNELDNLIIGNAIDNWLLGGVGNDTLDGGAGQDILYGQAGSDTFLIRKGTGIDIIADFAPGTDRLDVRDYAFKTTSALMSRMTQVGADVSVDLGGGDSLILMGVKMTSFGAADLWVV